MSRILFFKTRHSAPRLAKSEPASGSRIVRPSAPRIVAATERGAVPQWHGAFNRLVESIRTGVLPR